MVFRGKKVAKFRIFLYGRMDRQINERIFRRQDYNVKKKITRDFFIERVYISQILIFLIVFTLIVLLRIG